MEAFAGAGRALLGSQVSASDLSDKNYRPWEGALFQAGMIIICIGYTFCFWLASGTNQSQALVRFKWMLPGRLIVFVGHILLIVYAAADNDSLTYTDYLAWNICFALVNLVQAILIICNEKPIILHSEVEKVWDNMFGPEHYNLDKLDYYNLVQERAEVRSLKAKDVYFAEQDNPSKLSILVSGKMVIYKTDDWGRREVILPVFRDDENKEHVEMIVGEVNQFEFIDSFEFLAHGLEKNQAQVTIKAETSDVIIMSWDYDVLREIFKDFPRLRACMMAMVGKDIAAKLLSITGRELVGMDQWSDIIRKKDTPLYCWREAGLRETTLSMTTPAEGEEGAAEAEDPTKTWHPAFDQDEIIARLRIANARMLALVPSPLENLQPSAGVSSNPEHGAKLLNFFRRVVPDLPQRDLHELIKWGKWREYRKQFSIVVRKGEQPYDVGVVLAGQLDVLDEFDNAECVFKHSIHEFELVGSEDFGAKSRARSKRTVRVASHGAVLFCWDTKDLMRLMLADPRVESVISTLLRGDITLKLRDSQSLTNRMCGDLDAVRRDGEGRALCSNALC